MKITTRIILGYALFIAILAALVIYQVFTIERMREISDSLSGVSFQNARTSLNAMEHFSFVKDRTRKAFALSDPTYLEELKENQRNFERSLRDLKLNASVGEEQTEIQRLIARWNQYMADMKLMRERSPQSGYALPQKLEDDLAGLDTQIESMYQATLKSMDSKAQKARSTADTAVLVLWCATLVAIVISVLVSLLIVRSISKPLAHLTDGTRAIADGKFFYRLDTSRNDEFSQLARDFNKMTSRLNELDEMKKDFVSHVSHELKAPLASMRETIQLMLEQIPGPLTEKQKRLLELNLQSGTRLTSMISNLLDLSKTEAGVMEYELKYQDLTPLVRNAIAELEVHAHERQIQIKPSLPEGPLWIECDSDRIVQVMLNLVGNAVKFSTRHSEVNVQVEKVQQAPETIPERWRKFISNTSHDGYYALVTVSDSGPGIPDSDKEKVFEKFHQVKQGKKMPGQGVGLGLSICRTIVQAHRGAIWVEDNPGGGSRFMMLLRKGNNGEEGSAASTPL